jgi:hypothetical protein
VESTGVKRGTGLPLSVAAACAAAVLALGGCAGHGTASAPVSAQASGAGATAGSSSAAASSCNADYCEPADWDTARASTPLSQIPPFVEPLNVVISARSTVSLADIQQSLGKWKTVSTATTVNLAGIRLKCISSEMADVAGHDFVPQDVAWRLGGCVDGNELSISGNEDHVRIWNQPVAGSKYGAWFIAASYETMCLVRNGQLQTVSTNKAYAVLHPGSAYHCVDGGPGSLHTTHPDGYEDAAADFTAAIVAAAKSRGWQVSRQTVSVKRGAGSGEGGVPFGAAVYVLTVTA